MRQLSKALMPCSSQVQEDLRKKHKVPNASFYHNEVGELFYIERKPSEARPDVFNVFVFKAGKKNDTLEYHGFIKIDEKKTARLQLFGCEKGNSITEKPPLERKGRQAFRIIIEEALRLGAKRVNIVPLNHELAKYYRSRFGFRNLPKGAGVVLTKKARMRRKPI